MDSKKLIYCILVTAIFNAVLRISPESTITLFRLTLPFCFILIWKISKKTFKILINSSLLFICLALVQNNVSNSIFFPHIKTITILHLLMFCIHYISMFVVAALIYCLKIINPQYFFIDLINFFSNITKFILFIYIPYVLIGGEPDQFLVFGNINDLGCILTGGVLVILFDTITTSKKKYLYIIVILFLLLYNDSKLSLFGAIFEICLYGIHQISVKYAKAKKIIFITLGIVTGSSVYTIFYSDLNINGYSLYDIISIPYKQITSGIYFGNSSQSYTFRSNNIIGITEILKNTYGLGVGPGNTSLILKYLIPDPDGTIRQDYVASHIWWYEIMADLGWIIIIPIIIIYIKEIKQFISLKSYRSQLFSQIFILTFPIWCMSSSGLYTEFYSISLISLSIIMFFQRKKHKKSNNLKNIHSNNLIGSNKIAILQDH